MTVGVDPVAGNQDCDTQPPLIGVVPSTLARPPETERRSSSPISPEDFDGFLLLSDLAVTAGFDFAIGMKTSRWDD
jgi:hypothetical protein